MALEAALGKPQDAAGDARAETARAAQAQAAFAHVSDGHDFHHGLDGFVLSLLRLSP